MAHSGYKALLAAAAIMVGCFSAGCSIIVYDSAKQQRDPLIKPESIPKDAQARSRNRP